MDPEKETQVLEPELDEQDQETQESRKQASANDGDKTQTLLYRLWLKSQQKRKPKPGRDGAEKSGEDEPDEEDASEPTFAQQASVISDAKQTAWLEDSTGDGILDLWQQWVLAYRIQGQTYDPFSEIEPAEQAESPEGGEGDAASEEAGQSDRLPESSKENERDHMMTELQQAAQVRRAHKQLDEGESNKNALLYFWLSKDVMTVWMFAFPPLNGGMEMTVDAVDARLESMGVNFGINRDLILQAVSKRMYFKLLPIAKGQPPVDGIDGRLENCREMTVKLEEEADEEQNVYHSINQITRVVKGTPLFRAIPPVEMQMGINVQGGPVRGKTAKPVMMPKIPNTQVSSDGSMLVSAIDGYLTFENNHFLVKTLLVINGDVDYSMGNLEHSGDILIYGDVCEGLVIRSTGSVEVRGMVESAQIYAKKNITLGKGINGNLTGRLEAQGDIRSNFIENCEVIAAGDIYASSILWSNVSCGGSLHVTTGRGTIIGGQLAVIRNVEAKLIGNGSNRYTKFVIGSTPQIVEKQRDLEQQVADIQKRLREVLKDLEFLKRQKSLDEDRTRILGKLRLEKPLLQMKERQKLSELGEVCEIIHNSNKGRIRCDVLYSGTSISIGSASIVVTSTYYKCNIYYWEDEVVIGTC